MRLALSMPCLAVFGAIQMIVPPSFAANLETADLTMRFGPYPTFRADLAPEPAEARPCSRGRTLLSFEGMVATAGAGARLQSARLDGGIDLWRSRGFAVGVVGGATHEPVPSSGAQDRLRTQLLFRWSARSAGVWVSGAADRSLRGADPGGRTESAGGVWFSLGSVDMSATAARSVAPTKEQVLIRYTRSLNLPWSPDSVATWYEPAYLDRDVVSTEFRLAMGVASARLEVIPTVGLRSISMRGTRSWIQADASYWIAPRLALAARVSSTGVSDDNAGRTDALSFTIGGRLAPWRRVGHSVTPQRIEPQFESWELLDGGDSTRVLRVRALGVSRIDLQGDVTGWLTLPFEREEGDSWIIRMDASPGSHRVRVRMNEGPWLLLPGAPSQEDDFGGVTSLLVFE